MGVNVKQILSKDDVKSTVNVAKPGFTPKYQTISEYKVNVAKPE